MFERFRILMVDEDRYLAEILLSVLDAFGVGSVRLVTTFDDAVRFIEDLPFDCVFVDWLGEQKNGLEVVRHIRSLEDPIARALPIVLCTARTELEDICTARDAGVTEIIAKPFSPKHVFNKLNVALFKTRNFISAEGFSGPDRRRHTGSYDGPERRGGYGLAQDQIDDVMDEGTEGSEPSDPAGTGGEVE